MNRKDEKLREMLRDYAARSGNENAAVGEHLRDEDFIRLIESPPPADAPASAAENNGFQSARSGKLSPLRRHLANCDLCLAQFRDFYAFFAPAADGDESTVAAKNEIDAGWQAFASQIAGNEETKEKRAAGFWNRLFSIERKANYEAFFVWGFAAALLLFLSGASLFIAWRSRNEKTQLAAELENQKQIFEDRLKTLETDARNRDLTGRQENVRLMEEREELQKRIDALQTQIERAKQEKNEREKPASLPPANQITPGDSLVAINTPIYDVFPADSAVRGNGRQAANKLTVPNAAKTVVLILNAAGRADFSAFRAELVNSAGKIIWRGSGLRKDTLGNFTLSLSRSALKNGNYRLRLFGGNKSDWQPVAEYQITVEIK